MKGPRNAGELNYLITLLFLEYLGGQGLSYQTLNDCMGAAQGATLELYRRVGAGYEDRKRLQNGEVFTTVALDAGA